MRILKTNWLVYLDLGLLCLLLVALLLPSTSPSTHAVEERATATTAPSSVAISVPNSLDIDVRSDGYGSTQVSTAPISIKTTNTSKYQIFLSTADGSSFLRSQTVTNYAAIPTLKSTLALSDFPNNTWGFNFSLGELQSNALFEPVPTTPTAVKTQLVLTSATTVDQWNLSIAAKLTTDIPADTYSNKLLISVVSEPIVITGFENITTMQEMTTSICNNAMDYIDVDHYATKQLIDNRDGKKYWIGKLADGKCWMQQNLDLDIKVSSNRATSGTGTVLTNANTDISAAYWGNAVASGATEAGGLADGSINSWDVGKFVLNNPTASSDCGNMTGILSASLAKCPVFTKIEDCMDDDYSATETSSVSGNSYDAHYLIGNYYSVGAATAGTIGSISSGEAPGSICPKGWRLANTIEWAVMSSQYNIPDCSSSCSALFTRIATAPLYLVTGGYVAPGSYMSVAGAEGEYWSQSVNTPSTGYLYEFSSTGIRRQATSYRVDGRSVRCVAR